MSNPGSANRFEIRSPMDELIEIPIDPGPHEASDITEPEAGIDHFDEHGFVVLRGFVPRERCEAIVRTYEAVLKPWPGELPRYPTSAVEKSNYDDKGRVENGFMGAHRWTDPGLADFTAAVGEVVAPESKIAQAASVLMKAPAVLIDSFYFELNGNTTPHRDIDFLPSAEKIVVMWIAFEDIAPGAGRLYLYPGTHAEHVPLGAHSIVTSDYSQQSLTAARSHGTACLAPAIRRGDVIAFNGALVHGSLETRDRASTRHSLAAHFGPAHAKIIRS